MKKAITLLSIFFLLVISACSNDEVKPEDRLKEYVDNWNEQTFTDMYDMLSDATKEAYPKEQYIDRYQKIYEDLSVSNLKVTYEVPEEDEETKEETPRDYPIHVEMDTVAGPISFDSTITMVQQETEEEKNWYAEWDPGLIFPEIKDGGEIAFETTPPARGEIYDRNHNGLAVNASIFEIGVVPERFGDKPEEEKEQIAELLDISVETITDAMDASWVQPSYFVPLKVMPSLTEQDANELIAQVEPLTYKTTTGRIYPYGKAAAHLVGYIGKVTAERLEKLDENKYSASDSIGYRGLEELYEEQLKGEKGLKILVKKENEEDVVLAEKPVKHGENITLTIDAEVQKAIYTAYQGDAGTAAAIDPKTGETLALVSSPAFDPNQMAYGISQTDYDNLQNDELNPLLNRFTSTFSPGSTIKPITGAIGLESGAISPGEGIEINGLTWRKDGWGNYSVRRVSESNGPVDLTDALVRSDNIYFAKKAVEMGNETLLEGLHSFGFGEELPFTYPIRESSVTNSGEIDREVLLADTGYGQGEMQMSALHLATTYTAILNDGNMMKPVLESTEETGQIWKEYLLSSENAQVIKDALRQVVTASNGTARGANISEVQLSGKTGTAELKGSQDEDGQENGWFVSYPAEEDIIISMMVEHIEDKSQGSGYVVNKVADIYKEIR